MGSIYLNINLLLSFNWQPKSMVKSETYLSQWSVGLKGARLSNQWYTPPPLIRRGHVCHSMRDSLCRLITAWCTRLCRSGTGADPPGAILAVCWLSRRLHDDVDVTLLRKPMQSRILIVPWICIAVSLSSSAPSSLSWPTIIVVNPYLWIWVFYNPHGSSINSRKFRKIL